MAMRISFALASIIAVLMLFAILHDASGLNIVEKCGGNVDNLKTSLENFFNENLQMIPEESEYVLQQTIGFQRVIQRAVNHVRSAEKKEVAVGDILASIFMEKDSHAVFFLNEEGISRLDVLRMISHELFNLIQGIVDSAVLDFQRIKMDLSIDIRRGQIDHMAHG